MDTLEEMDKCMKGTDFQIKSEERKYKETNQKNWNWNCDFKTSNK